MDLPPYPLLRGRVKVLGDPSEGESSGEIKVFRDLYEEPSRNGAAGGGGNEVQTGKGRLEESTLTTLRDLRLCRSYCWEGE